MKFFIRYNPYTGLQLTPQESPLFYFRWLDHNLNFSHVLSCPSMYAGTYYNFYYSRCATRSFVSAQRNKDETTANVPTRPYLDLLLAH